MNSTEIAKLQAYLRDTFNNDSIVVKKRAATTDSVELLLGDEFLGVIYKDVDEGEVSYPVTMTILQEDLPEL